MSNRTIKINIFPITKCFVALLLVMLFSCSAVAQNLDSMVVVTPKVNRFFVIGASANAYRGDLSERYATWTPALQMSLAFNKKKRWNGSLQLSVGHVIGQSLGYTYSDTKTPNATPNDYFKTSFFTIGYQLQYNLVKNKRWTWYLSQGMELMRFTPRDREDRNLADQKATRAANETYSTTTLALPSAMGFVYTLNNGMGLGMKAGWRNPNTDYLDNVSKWSKASQKDNIAFWAWTLSIPMKQ